MVIDYETTKERCQRSTDDLEYQANEDINVLMQEIKEDTDYSEQETKDNTNIENDLSSTTENELKALEDELVALVHMLYV